MRQIAPLVVDLQGVTACSRCGLVIGLQHCNSFQKKNVPHVIVTFFVWAMVFLAFLGTNMQGRIIRFRYCFKNHVVWAISLKTITFQ